MRVPVALQTLYNKTVQWGIYGALADYKLAKIATSDNTNNRLTV